MRWIVVALGGAAGAMARFGVVLLVARFWRREFPLATLFINVAGSFAVGFLAERLPLDPLWRLMIVTGFVGAFTTFSTFEYETQHLAESGAWLQAAAYVAISVISGFVAVRLGVMLGRALA